ncbi:MAG: HlyC/CorC family transporter [Clostridia bacterium]|nr:HlyC/CorC family transporter [Clostridia bacterium]
MDGDSTLLLIFIVCVALSAFFSSSESSFATMNKIRIKQKADDGNKKAKNALFISNNYDKAITTLLIGNNIVNIAASSVATIFALNLFENYAGLTNETANLLTTLVTTVIIFLCGEMIPKSYALDKSETVALRSAAPMRFLMKLLRPFTFIFNGITTLVSKLFKAENLPTITEDELKDIITTAEEEGVVDEEQSDLLMSAIQFSGTTAANVMTARDQIIAISADISREDLLALIQTANHSRLPVYEGDIDHIIGYLQTRTYLRAYLKDEDVNIRDILIPPFFVSPDAKIDDLLTVMRQHKFYMAVVSETCGGEDIDGTGTVESDVAPCESTLGIVTIEDFLEELVGDIWDESDEIDHTFTKLGGNKYKIDTHLTVAEAFARMNCPEPEARIAKIPLLAWIVQEFKHIPELDESFEYGNMEITVDEIDGHRVSYITVKIDVSSSATEGEADEENTSDTPAASDEKADKEVSV